MRITNLFTTGLLGTALLLGACGGRDTAGTPDLAPPPNKCGSCASYEVCLTSGVCGINPNSTWFFGVSSALISTMKSDGSAWDTLGGAPDPYLLLDGSKTTPKQDTFTPTWSPAEGVITTATDLLNQGVTIEAIDDDLTQPDRIGGPSVVRPTEADLRRGSLTVSNLGQAQTLTFQLSPR